MVDWNSCQLLLLLLLILLHSCFISLCLSIFFDWLSFRRHKHAARDLFPMYNWWLSLAVIIFLLHFRIFFLSLIIYLFPFHLRSFRVWKVTSFLYVCADFLFLDVLLLYLSMWRSISTVCVEIGRFHFYYWRIFFHPERKKATTPTTTIDWNAGQIFRWFLYEDVWVHSKFIRYAREQWHNWKIIVPF